MATEESVRLHISPFNHALYDAVIPKSLQPVVKGLSYHHTQVDPDRGFGYIELPKPEAEKLRKKLNGLTLRGKKMSLELARPERKRPLETEDEPQPEKKQKRSKKTKAKLGDLTGHELPEGREVKRGWTEASKQAKTSDKKQKREKSKYTNDKELLFKTSGKGHKVSTTEPEAESKTEKKKKSKSGPVVVHEFEKTTKYPTFLRNEQPKRAAGTLTFVDGEGWVDEEGKVIEPVKQRPGLKPRERQGTEVAKPVQPIDSPVGNAVELSSSDKEASDADTSDEDNVRKQPTDDLSGTASKHTETSDSSVGSSDSDTSSSEDESDESDSSSDLDSGSEEHTALVAEDKDDTTDVPQNTEDVQEQVFPQQAEALAAEAGKKEIHPLEALYKRRKDKPAMPAPIDTSFSFFAADDDIDGDHDTQVVDAPQTPYTKQDLRQRGLRSAAPTPDTAAIGKRFSFAFGKDYSDDEDGEARSPPSPLAERMDVAMEPLNDTDLHGAQEESEHAKEFWAKRGDRNRAWKKRRREVTKLERQRENRKTGRRLM